MRGNEGIVERRALRIVYVYKAIYLHVDRHDFDIVGTHAKTTSP
ncbi:MAG: hypothetical protein ABIF87_12190 [Pseudomonadota bacterium]